MTATNSELALTWDQALAWRLGRQLLDSPGKDPVQVTSTTAGVQAQVASSAAQAIAIRSKRVPDIESLLWEKRSLVKTWAMRGTLHLLPASEMGTWIAALRQRPWKITPAWEKYHGITKSQLDSLTAAIPSVMSAEPMTREELTAAIVAETRDRGLGEALASGWSQVLKPAANQGLLAQGPPRGRNVTFVDPGAWLGNAIAESTAGKAMQIVIEKFLDANGPATTADFARWFGVDPKTGRVLMTPVIEKLVSVEIEGYQAWLTSRGARAAAKTSPAHGAYLLPGFDPYTLAPISHREHIIPAGKVDEVSRAAGWIAPVVLVDGRIVGTWESENGAIALQPFGKIPKKTVSMLEDHIEQRYHGLLGKSIAVTVP
ncbi:MAG TPA: crosslink repair DNA glycosylase YcaQ family protein [Acidimicrobiia bacterium]|nr:crosslink repair DNA glycosylase YcaQ family protein [Acidimicrobiia bacterium]